jgi:hypothetical protein
MAFYNSIAHAVGNVVSPVLQGVGTVAGRDDLVAAGKAISNPYTTLTSVGNLGHGGASGFTVGPQPTYSQQGQQQNQTPKKQNEGQVLGASIDIGGGGGSNADAELARYQLEGNINQYQDALGRVDSQLGNALNNISGDYQSAYDRLTGQQQVARRDNQTQVNNQLQDYQTARDSNDANSRNLLMGARRLLGAQGAGGGSADLFAAPLAAQQEGNNANAVVKQTNERNLGALSTAYDDNERQFGNQFNMIATQKDQGIRDTQSQFAQQRADALAGIGTLQGQKAILNGQNYQAALAAAAPYTSRVQGLLSQIDALAARPTGVREGAVNLARPDLAQYSLGRFDAPAVAQQDPTLGALPAYSTLVGQPDDQRRQLLGA